MPTITCDLTMITHAYTLSSSTHASTTDTFTLGALTLASTTNSSTPTSIIGASTLAPIDTMPHLYTSSGMDTNDPTIVTTHLDPSRVIIVNNGGIFPITLHTDDELIPLNGLKITDILDRG
jgi:hypothetical protein